MTMSESVPISPTGDVSPAILPKLKAVNTKPASIKVRLNSENFSNFHFQAEIVIFCKKKVNKGEFPEIMNPIYEFC